MSRIGARRRIGTARAALTALGIASATLVPAANLRAQAPSTEAADAGRIERLEKLVTTVVEENRRLADEVRTLKKQLETRTPAPPSPSVPPAVSPEPNPRPEPAEAPSTGSSYWEASAPASAPESSSSLRDALSRYRVDYKDGFSILPENLDETPFSLRVRSQNVFRYTGFARTATSWTDSAGNRIPIDDSNYFGVPRGRLIFSGTALLPRLTFLLNIDYNSVTSNPIGFRAYELGYKFNRSFELYVGQTKVPGSREWMESAFAALQGPDRSMATTFFRPSLSQGIWIVGNPFDGAYYHAMMSNGFNTLNLQPQFLNNRFCWSGTAWWEPLGDFGRGYSDIQHHLDPAVRVGGSYTFAAGRGSQTQSDAVENSPIRLSDGTIITTTGALAPGVTVQTYDLSLAAIDLALKYRGLGVSTELYLQDLSGLSGNGPLPINATRAFGGFVQGGYFVIPKQAELYTRGSFVTGDFGSGSEIAGGFNWFFLEGKDNLRYTFDFARLDSSPAGQNRTGYVAGQTGFLIRTQVTVVY